MCRVEYSEGLHDSSFPLLSTGSRPLPTCFRSDCTVSDIPHNRFRFPDRAFPFPFPFPNKNMKTKMVRVFSRPIPTAFIPNYRKLVVSRVPESLPCALSRAHGKEHICRVPRKGHTANLTAHGKGLVCRVPRRRHTAKQWTHGSAGCLPCAMIYNTRQKKNTRQNVFFAMCYEGHTAKCGLCRVFISGTRQICLKKIHSAFETFLLIFILYVGLYTRFWYFSRSFCYI